MCTILKHDKYIEVLIKKIEHNYKIICTQIPIFSKKKRLIGEIDVIAINEQTIDIFEIKSSFHIKKAKRQLSKIKKIIHMSCNLKINTYFYCGESESLIATAQSSNEGDIEIREAITKIMNINVSVNPQGREIEPVKVKNPLMKKPRMLTKVKEFDKGTCFIPMIMH